MRRGLAAAHRERSVEQAELDEEGLKALIRAAVALNTSSARG